MRDTIDMAREAGFADWLDARLISPPPFERLVALARADAIAHEREACAKVCEQEAAGINSEWDCCHETLQDTAAAIRARGENNG
jgi:hypothetical protein